jgi:hypothetical protein
MYESVPNAPAGMCILAAFVWIYDEWQDSKTVSIFGRPAPLYAEAAQWLNSTNN